MHSLYLITEYNKYFLVNFKIQITSRFMFYKIVNKNIQNCKWSYEEDVKKIYKIMFVLILKVGEGE